MPSLYIGEQPVRTVALASNNDDATAVAADVMKDKIAYNQYGKIVGTAEPAEDLDNEMTAQDSLIEQIKSAVASKASVSYPTLSNPASAGNIESGYEAIDGSGNKITGTATVGRQISITCTSYFGTPDKNINNIGTGSWFTLSEDLSVGEVCKINNYSCVIIYRNNSGLFLYPNTGSNFTVAVGTVLTGTVI